jgi:PKD repeat protein
MKRIFISITACLVVWVTSPSASAQINNYTVQVSAVAQSASNSIDFSWPADAGATGYDVYRKTLGSISWGFPLLTLPGTATTWSDTLASAGENYEYQFRKAGSGYTGYGYVYAGVNVSAIEDRGIILLVIDTTYAAGLAMEIDRLVSDLEGDGWRVQMIEVDRADPVTSVKASIVNAYNTFSPNVKSVFLLGHVPVPYSGNLAPDGHVPDHQGAWPADAYYGEMNGNWTDASINNVGATRPQNQNSIGDGKFDQTTIPTEVELQVGRVDFANMPSFTEGEEELLRRYLNKDHAWRHKQFTVSTRAVVDDNFGVFIGPPLENFATSGFRNFAPFVGSANVVAGDYRTEMLSGQSCLWSYGCGAGSYTSASGVTTTPNFVNDSLSGVFSMIFGSYHGDWDVSDNLMRAALASKGTILSCAWGGRPQWHFYHMGLGEVIGYGARITMNNNSLFVPGYGARMVHIALMGDPALRMHVVAPATNLVISTINGGRDNQLNWTASADAILGYYVYRAEGSSAFVRITPSLIPVNNFIDQCVAAGDYRYMVRAMKLENGNSGSYYNLSQGVIGSVTNTTNFALSTQSLPVSSFCPGDTVQVDYTATGPWCSGNIYYAEISDAAGSFASPDTIGMVADTTSGFITGIIPGSLPPGVGYRIRVVGGQPILAGTDNGSDLQLLDAPNASFTFIQSNATVNFTNSSSTGTYLWDFGDGDTSSATNPVHDYPASNSYTVTLIVTNACGSDTSIQVIGIVGIADVFPDPVVTIFPVPAEDEVRVSSSNALIRSVEMYSIQGVKVSSFELSGITSAFRMDLKGVPAGSYFLRIETDKGSFVSPLIIQ